MGAGTIAGGLVAILALALFFLWRKSDQRGKEIVRQKSHTDNLQAAKDARDEQDEKDRDVAIAGRDPAVRDLVRDAIDQANKPAD